MFTLTQDWLRRYYGSKDNQKKDAENWLLRHGKNVPKDKIDAWSYYKHLIEYQPNTPDIVPQCMNAIGTEFRSELEAHSWVNSLRCPTPARAYKEVLELVQPNSILELGVGGDSAISTGVYLAFLEEQEASRMLSIDYHKLETVWERYKDVPFWTFEQKDSVQALIDLERDYRNFDLIFIDTIHSYTHTLEELEKSAKMTFYICLDDCDFQGNDFDPEPGGVKKALEVWLEGNKDWRRVDLEYGNNVALIEKKVGIQSNGKEEKIYY